MGLTIGVRFIKGGKSKREVIINEIRGRNAYLSGTTKIKTNRRLRRGVVPQDPRQVGHMSKTEPEMSRLERQLMLKNPPQFQDKEGGKDQ